ncbi:Tetratricopeptide repeat protein [Wickerhamomyces ciferrii]|uniref:Tetratricopeptide repeat protein n=1 Tax=Wickerhamomyces ciferrii (strain ATCC 14091 / BCRC 22168 / CBS 111 / JCM 3599 / NBRC 0793 / NRRL Y-1031 F-60-10) TaxID=1206466 RepID=K0KIH6_WICCF|nr:Tetratricopeptide repeat protein [Wickerhamomyces ciferrii]CCH41982.1 Tetratricopeptide repeat protein [Wickerhamomyces ciferrii]
MDVLRLIHSQLILSLPLNKLELPQDAGFTAELTKLILNGEYHKVLQHETILPIIESNKSQLIASENINENIANFATNISKDQQTALFIAIASLYLFIQNNFTGPQSPLKSIEFLYPEGSQVDQIHQQAIDSLSAYGQVAYDGAQDPLYLLLSLHILEKLANVSKSLLLNHFNSSEEFVEEENLQQDDVLKAAINWWRSRAIMIQLSLFPEFSGPHISVSASILNASVVKALGFGLNETLQQQLSIIYQLEKSKNSLDSNLEHLAQPHLSSVRNLTNFEFVLTGAKAKRTKFQTKANSGLIVLAKSNYFVNDDITEQSPESYELNSDLLLEKPHFEDIGNEDIDEQIYKKQKTDLQEIDYSTLLPVSLRSEYIPESLKSLDPNNQPQLSDYDNIQLLLRLYTLRQTSPSNDNLVSAQLMSLVSRVLYQSNTTAINYTIFSRALWERSILETTKARTIERGILQMQSLVEEIGLKIQTRFIPTSNDEISTAATRSRYIFQIPSIPRWDLDTKLAEKFMSLGLIKSAIEIYERLGLEVDVALCHATIGEESKAIEIIKKRISNHPNDARAIAVLGDLLGEPEYWYKAWEIGKYVKAKVSLSKYNYYPPKGIERNIEQAIIHMNDALSINPINFSNWFFYGCLGLESNQFELAAEAFTRCVALDDSNSLSWSNLASAHLSLNKTREAFHALKKAVASTDNKKSWRIWDNYLIVAAKLKEWDEVLLACRRLVENRKDESGEGSIDIPVVEKLVEMLVQQDYPNDEEDLTFFQKSCIEFTTIMLPNVINSSSRLWRIISRVELWRKRPWASLECHEKAYRALSHNPELELDETVWNDTVEACSDLVAAYESLGELPGKHGADDLVCKDWRYKAVQTIKSLMSKGRQSWEDTEGWEQLKEMRKSL